MSFFADLHSDDARLGGKDRSLARLSAAGLRTPAGFVVTHELFRAIGPARSLPERIDDAALAELDRARADLLAAPFPAGFSEELAGRLVQHALWSVRSSFANEDVPGGLGAGVYESRVAVRADEVGQAIRQVLASAQWLMPWPMGCDRRRRPYRSCFIPTFVARPKAARPARQSAPTIRSFRCEPEPWRPQPRSVCAVTCEPLRKSMGPSRWNGWRRART